jgi:hypothetical protein
MLSKLMMLFVLLFSFQGQVNNHLAAYQPPLPPQAQPPPAVAAAAAAGDVDGQQQQHQEEEGTPAAAPAAAAAAGNGPTAARPPPAPSQRPRPHAIVSAAAAWFKPNAVHPLERAAVPQFSSGSGAEGGVGVSRMIWWVAG